MTGAFLAQSRVLVLDDCYDVHETRGWKVRYLMRCDTFAHNARLEARNIDDMLHLSHDGIGACASSIDIHTCTLDVVCLYTTTDDSEAGPQIRQRP